MDEKYINQLKAVNKIKNILWTKPPICAITINCGEILVHRTFGGHLWLDKSGINNIHINTQESPFPFSEERFSKKNWDFIQLVQMFGIDNILLYFVCTCFNTNNFTLLDAVCVHVLHVFQIEVPMFILNAADDPLVPHDVYDVPKNFVSK